MNGRAQLVRFLNGKTIGCMVGAMQLGRALAVLAVTFSCVGAKAGEVISFKTVDGKQIACMHTGLMSDLNDCGTRSDSYSYVFVGSISRVTPRLTTDLHNEFELQIVPEEIFSGKPDKPLTVLTSQGLCLPKLAVGDRWLFYLRKDAGEPIVLDFYGNESRPLADAQEQIATLRYLQKIGDHAVLRGRVWGRDKPVPNAHVTAPRKSDNAPFVSTTDANGHYEFQPLSPGDYKITVAPIESYRPDELDLSPGACRDLQLSPSPHGQIGGHVRRSDGSPVANAYIVLFSSYGWNLPTQTDKNGHYLFDWQEPGKYVLGLNLPGRPNSSNRAAGKNAETHPSALFYPGVAKRSEARVIQLRTNEKLDHLDFTLPAQ